MDDNLEGKQKPLGSRQCSFLMEVSAEVLLSIGLGLGKVAIANGPAPKVPLADKSLKPRTVHLSAYCSSCPLPL